MLNGLFNLLLKSFPHLDINKYIHIQESYVFVYVEWQPTQVFFPGESPWTEESGRLQSQT